MFTFTLPLSLPDLYISVILPLHQGHTVQTTGLRQDTVTFVVGLYDIGKNALEGRPGVLDVEKGWLGISEINTIKYDTEQVSIQLLESWLKNSDAYIRTVP